MHSERTRKFLSLDLPWCVKSRCRSCAADSTSTCVQEVASMTKARRPNPARGAWGGKAKAVRKAYTLTLRAHATPWRVDYTLRCKRISLTTLSEHTRNGCGACRCWRAPHTTRTLTCTSPALGAGSAPRAPSAMGRPTSRLARRAHAFRRAPSRSPCGPVPK